MVRALTYSTRSSEPEAFRRGIGQKKKSNAPSITPRRTRYYFFYRVLREEVIPLYYAEGLDQTHEAHHTDSGLAVQWRPYGHGLHALCSRGGRHFERYERSGLNLFSRPPAPPSRKH